MYNEETNVERCVRAVSQELASLPQHGVLLVVNDGSKDRTGAILERLESEITELAVLTHATNGGYGEAMRTGFAWAAEQGLDYVLVMDSDLTNHPKYIPLFVERMLEGVDVIKASRYVPGGRMVGVPAHRVLVSVVGNRLVRWLMRLSVTDCTNGFRAVKTGLVAGMPLTERGFPVIMEELYFAKYLACSFCEIPYTLTSRLGGEGRSRFQYRPAVFWQYLKYPLKAFLGIRARVGG